MVTAFTLQVVVGESPQFVVDEGYQRLESVLVAVPPTN
jgi:hypothetical protein